MVERHARWRDLIPTSLAFARLHARYYRQKEMWVVFCQPDRRTRRKCNRILSMGLVIKVRADDEYLTVEMANAAGAAYPSDPADRITLKLVPNDIVCVRYVAIGEVPIKPVVAHRRTPLTPVASTTTSRREAQTAKVRSAMYAMLLGAAERRSFLGAPSA